MSEKNEEEKMLPLGTAEDLAQKIKPFLDRHKFSKVGVSDNSEQSLVVERPWGDPTLDLYFEEFDAEADVLNSVLLPRRLSALWHLDTNDLEVIWTAFDLSTDQRELADRTFNFTFEGKTYVCQFGRSSERLMTIAQMAVPSSNPSETNFRNLVSFGLYGDTSDEETRKRSGLDVPRSFWIRNAKLSEGDLISLIERLNFHMSYYDAQSPVIVVHGFDDGSFQPRRRFPLGSFPSEISSEPLDENLLSFWSAARRENEMLQFILYYRIIEYAAFHYVDVAARDVVLRLLRNPVRSQDPESAVQTILEALDPTKMGGDERFNAIIEAHVSPEAVWSEIEANKAAFSRETKFDGEFVLDPIIGRKETLATFKVGGLAKFSGALRRIRNVVAHGRDQRSATVITPSFHNLRLLRPWVSALATAAGEVIMYQQKH